MVKVAQIERQVLDKYNSLKEKAIGEFNINMVAHLMGKEILAQLDSPDYACVSIAFVPVAVKTEITERFPYTVTGYNLSGETTFDERLVVGSISKSYGGEVSGTVVLDRTLQVFDELGLNFKITGDAHLVEVRRAGNLNLYVVDENSRLTAQVMDGSDIPTFPVKAVPADVRYGELVEMEKELSAENFRDYLAQVEKEFLVSGAVFKYDRGSETLAESALVLYGLLGLTDHLNELLERRVKDADGIRSIESLAEKVDTHLSAFRKSLKK